MKIEKEVKGKRIFDASGFIRGYAYDPDCPSLDQHIFIMFKVLPENGLLDRHFKTQYGDAFVKTYIKHIDFKPYNIYVFKRDLDIICEVMAIGDIIHNMPLEDDDSLYLPDDYSLTVNKF